MAFLSEYSGYSEFGAGPLGEAQCALCDSIVNFAVWEKEGESWTDDPIFEGIDLNYLSGTDSESQYVYLYQIVNTAPNISTLPEEVVQEFNLENTPLFEFSVSIPGAQPNDPDPYTSVGYLEDTVFADGEGPLLGGPAISGENFSLDVPDLNMGDALDFPDDGIPSITGEPPLGFANNPDAVDPSDFRTDVLSHRSVQNEAPFVGNIITWEETADGLIEPDETSSLIFLTSDLPPDFAWARTFSDSPRSFGATADVVGGTLDEESRPTINELFPSPLNPQENLSAEDIIFLGDEADFFDSTDSDNGRRIYGGEGNDEFLVNTESRVFGEDGEDILDATLGSGRNLLHGGNNNDILLAGSSDQLVGGEGDDLLYINQGSNNLLYGGSGNDQFKIVNSRLPNTIEVQNPEDTSSLLSENLSTGNTIMDFELGIDQIHITGLEGVSSFDDLQLLPTFEDLGSTSIVASFTEDGVEEEISLANVAGIASNELSADDFVFA